MAARSFVDFHAAGAWHPRCTSSTRVSAPPRVLHAGDLVFISDPPSLKRLFGADRRNTIAPGRNVVLKPLLGEHSLLLGQPRLLPGHRE